MKVILLLIGIFAAILTIGLAAAGQPYAYVAGSESGAVYVINAETDVLETKIPVEEGKPWDVAASPDGRKVYVTTLYDVLVIDTRTDEIVDTIQPEFSSGKIAVSPDGGTIYVTHSPDNKMSVISAADHSVIKVVDVGLSPNGIAVNNAGKKIYVSNWNEGTVYVIDSENYEIVKKITVGTGPSTIVISSDDRRAYVVCAYSGSAFFIDAEADEVIREVKVGKNPYGICVSPDGERIYVLSWSLSWIGTISTIDKEGNILSTIDVGRDLRDIFTNPDGSKLYVTDTASDAVFVVNPLSGEIAAKIPVGQYPTAVVVVSVPDKGPALKPVAEITILNQGSYPDRGVAPFTVYFSDTSTNVLDRFWNFGDGSGSTEVDPVHTYEEPGDYTVNLTVTNTVGSDSAEVVIHVLQKLKINDFQLLQGADITGEYTGFSLTVTNLENPKKTQTFSYSREILWEDAIADVLSTVLKGSGSYNLTLRVWDDQGYSDSMTRNNYLVVTKDVFFASDVTKGTAPLTVQFIDRTPGGNTNWYWNFGDGFGSTKADPVHIYEKSGKYQVSLITFNCEEDKVTMGIASNSITVEKPKKNKK